MIMLLHCHETLAPIRFTARVRRRRRRRKDRLGTASESYPRGAFSCNTTANASESEPVEDLGFGSACQELEMASGVSATNKAFKQTTWGNLNQRSSLHPPSRISPLFDMIFRLLTVILTISLPLSAQAARIAFRDCLDESLRASQTNLHFTPIVYNATFLRDSTGQRHLTLAVYGNITDAGGGGIIDVPDADPDPSKNFAATLGARIGVLTYDVPHVPYYQFCATTNMPCPLLPSGNLSQNLDHQNFTQLVNSLPGFNITQPITSSYAFASFSTELTITTGGNQALRIGCIQAEVTPDLTTGISNVISFVPLGVLIFVALATILAAIKNPWNGTSDIFRWSSNYGRDEDMLRLVTPGFGDCLQYLQFVVLTASLSLNYPGFYQPVVSKIAWSVLMFNTSLASPAPTNSTGSQTQGISRLIDGVYAPNATWGLERMSQLVGQRTRQDIFPGFIVFLVGIVGGVALLIQVGFVVDLVYRKITRRQSEDLRHKNTQFTGGNVIRLVFNFFYHPLISFCIFQLLAAGGAPVASPVIAGLLLFVMIVAAGLLVRKITVYRPRKDLFDELPTLLLYGPLYNTYQEDYIYFSVVQLILPIIRGIAVGAVQPSGIAQLVLLAVCEVVQILTLNAFRPFHPRTSMNIYHTFLSVVRLLMTLFGVTFIPSLEVADGARGWIAYVMLLMHAVVLIFGFGLNALQTTIEVFARMAGAGKESGHATRGGLSRVFGMRQLQSRRVNRVDPRDSNTVTGTPNPQSVDGDRKLSNVTGNSQNRNSYARPLSQSGSSAILLGGSASNNGQADAGFENQSVAGGYQASYASQFTPTTPGAQSGFSYLGAGSSNVPRGDGAIVGLGVLPRNDSSSGPYYRPPRRRLTSGGPDSLLGASPTPSGRDRGLSVGNGSEDARTLTPHGQTALGEDGRPMSASDWDQQRGSAIAGPSTENDYTKREADMFYFGVRGSALSSVPARPLGTGPADPTGPVASAKGWLMKKIGRGTDNKGKKGFEVVRSARAPPPMEALDNSGPARSGAIPQEDPSEEEEDAAKRAPVDVDSDTSSFYDDDQDQGPPRLPDIDVTSEGIELPSRTPTEKSTRPGVPRKSSRRRKTNSFTGQVNLAENPMPTLQVQGRTVQNIPNEQMARLPFTTHLSDESGVTQGTMSPFTQSGNSQNLAPLDALGRPTSMGVVQRHRMEDSLRHVDGAGAEGRFVDVGSSAEFVEEGASTKPSPLSSRGSSGRGRGNRV